MYKDQMWQHQGLQKLSGYFPILELLIAKWCPFKNYFIIEIQLKLLYYDGVACNWWQYVLKKRIKYYNQHFKIFKKYIKIIIKFSSF